jgi:CrcB protein
MAAASRQDGLRLPAARNVGLVAFGGALGAAARVTVGAALPTAAGGWPWATMTANVSGALLLGLLLGAIRDAAVVGRWVRPMVGTGDHRRIHNLFDIVGGDAAAHRRRTAADAAAGYAVVTAAGGLAAVWLGWWVPR